MPALTRLAYSIGNPSLSSIGSPTTDFAAGGIELSRLSLQKFRRLSPICGSSPQLLYIKRFVKQVGFEPTLSTGVQPDDIPIRHYAHCSLKGGYFLRRDKSLFTAIAARPYPVIKEFTSTA